MLNIAVGAARRAGDLIVRQLKRLDTLAVDQKGHNEFVTQVDHAAEQLIIEHILKHYPDHSFLAEESGARGEGDYQWIIDPLDGTTNFIHGFPVFAVSIGLAVKGRLEHGVVYDPLRQEIFSASRGQGAQLDERRIRVSRCSGLDTALIGTGFPYGRAGINVDDYLAMLKAVIQNTAGVRRPGAAALDLCYLAAGRLDGFWELGLKSWDMAAGSLIIREAGGRVSDFDGGDGYLESGNIIAGTPKIYGALSKLLSPHTRRLRAR
jgi:myo-inositol-1(or 4)-monophosphatase